VPWIAQTQLEAGVLVRPGDDLQLVVNFQNRKLLMYKTVDLLEDRNSLRGSRRVFLLQNQIVQSLIVVSTRVEATGVILTSEGTGHVIWTHVTIGRF